MRRRDDGLHEEIIGIVKHHLDRVTPTPQGDEAGPQRATFPDHVNLVENLKELVRQAAARDQACGSFAHANKW